MPYVNIKITEEGVTSEQKAKLIEGVTNLLKDVLGKNPATRFLRITGVLPVNKFLRAGSAVCRPSMDSGRTLKHSPTLMALS